MDLYILGMKRSEGGDQKNKTKIVWGNRVVQQRKQDNKNSGLKVWKLKG